MPEGLPDLLGLEQGGHRVWGTKLEGVFQGVMRLLDLPKEDDLNTLFP